MSSLSPVSDTGDAHLHLHATGTIPQVQKIKLMRDSVKQHYLPLPCRVTKHFTTQISLFCHPPANPVCCTDIAGSCYKPLEKPLEATGALQPRKFDTRLYCSSLRRTAKALLPDSSTATLTSCLPSPSQNSHRKDAGTPKSLPLVAFLYSSTAHGACVNLP